MKRPTSITSSDRARVLIVNYERAIEKLAKDPQRFAIARENEDFPVKLQQINFGTKASRPTHRLLFYVGEQTVFVVTLRHLMQDDWKPIE